MELQPIDRGPVGIAIIDKPAQMTSHDVVSRARRHFGTRKVGHAGTLDPDATGVLVLGVGRATKLLTYLSGADKTYIGTFRLGAETTTLDAAGEVTATHDMGPVSAAQVQEAADTFLGESEQVPPMVSAIKVDGVRLHTLARKGIEVERDARPIRVDEFAVEATDDPLEWRYRIACSSGTYVRSLVSDLGHRLGGGAHVRTLRRTRVGVFDEAQALPLEEARLIEPLAAVAHLAVLTLSAAAIIRLANGGFVGEEGDVLAGAEVVVHQAPVAAVDADGTLVAVLEPHRRGYRPAVPFVTVSHTAGN